MDSVHFYQPPNEIRRPGQWRSAASNFEIRKERDNAMTYEPSSSQSGRLEDYDLTEYLDLTASPQSEDSFHPSLAPVLDPKSAESHAEGPSNIADTEGGHGNDDTLPSLEELLFGTGEVQESQRAGSSVEHGIGRSDRTFEHPTQSDCENASISGPRQDGDRGGDIDDSSSAYPRSGGSTPEEQGGEHCSLSTPSTSVAGSEAGCSILHEKTENPIFDHPPPLPHTLLSSTHDTQTCFKNIEPRHSGGRKEKGDKGASCSTDNIIPYSLRSPIASPTPEPLLVSRRSPLREDAVEPTGATNIRDSSKRTADSAGLNEGGEGGHGLKKTRCADPIVIDETDDTDDDLSDLEFARIRSQPKPVFRRPPFPRIFQQRKKTTSSSRSSEVGDSQGDPLVVEDDEEKTGETGGSTSMESEISTIHFQSSHPRKQPKTRGCLSPPTTTEPTTSPFDRPISPSVAPSRDPVEQAIRGGDRGAAATVYPLHAITVTPPLPEQPQDQGGSASDGEEWEIVRIVGKRRRGKGYEYKVCWTKTWLVERELGNAQELLRDFEAKHQAQRGGERGRHV